MPRGLLSRIYVLTGQPERGARIAREGRQEAATRGIDVLAGYFHAMEALAWTVAGDHATARRPATEAVQTARKVRNPALSAMACFVAAAALWLDKPRTALALIEDSLAPLSLAVAIRTRNGDLPGALALLPEATMQQHNDGNRLGLGGTLGRGAAVLAKVGEAEPAAVLAGAVAAHFPLSLANACREELLEIDEAQSLARGTLGEPAYSAAVRRGAAMDDAQVTDYALGEFRRLAALHAKPKAQGPGSELPPGMRTGYPDRPGPHRRPDYRPAFALSAPPWTASTWQSASWRSAELTRLARQALVPGHPVPTET